MDGYALNHLEAVALESDHLTRIVRQKPEFTDAEVEQNLGTHSIVPQIRREAQTFVGLHRVEALLLQFVSVTLRGQTDAATFLPQINQHAAAGLTYLAQRGVQLIPAIATPGTENIAGQAFAVHAHERGF